MNVRSGSGRDIRPLWLGLSVALSGSLLSHKNMSATAASGELNTDLDATQPGFDVYQAYQRALTDEEVSLRALLLLMGAVSSFSHPDIPPSSSDSIPYGARHAL